MSRPQEFDFAGPSLPPGLSVIEASAGTGKTYSISHLVPRLLLDATVSRLSEILLVTFTNDAAKELSERVRAVLEKLAAPPAPDEAAKSPGIARLRETFPDARHAAIIDRALLDIDQLGVSTIHSFSQRTLQTEGVLCGLPVVPELIPDERAILEQVVYDLWKNRIARDDVAAAIAAAGRWKIADDVTLALLALPLADATLEPTPAPFADVLASIAATPPSFTEPVCDELEEILGRIPNRKKDAPGEEKAAILLKALRDSRAVTDPGFLDAVDAFAELPDWIDSRTKVGKAVKAEAETIAGVRIAREVLAMLAQLKWAWSCELFAETRARIERVLHTRREITYNGLIDTLYRALDGAQADALIHRLRERYTVALIDESQDTDLRQFEIFRRVFVGPSTHRLLLIGDPKQAIYSFRGADVNTYLDARELAGDQRFHLTKTFRSPAALVRATNAIFSRPRAFLRDDLPFIPATSGIPGDIRLWIDGKPRTARLEAWITPDSEAGNYSNKNLRLPAIAGPVASEIVAILNADSELIRTAPDGTIVKRERVQPGHFAVLVSEHAEAKAVADALAARHVPAIRAGNEDVLDSDEAAEILTILRALQEPRRAKLRLAALATRLLGRTTSELVASRNDAAKDDALLEKFLHWQSTLEREGIAPALAQIDRDAGITQRLAASEHGERRITNLRQLTDLLEAASHESGNRPANLLRWLTQEIARADERSKIDERQQQLESDADAVQIVTMHSAKGLEYPLVFCPFLSGAKPVNGVRKLSRPKERPTLVDSSLTENSAIINQIIEAQIEDRLRLAYVAITRAKAAVWISCGAICGTKDKSASALDWLLRDANENDFHPWQAGTAQSARAVRHDAGWAAIIEAGGITDEIAVSRPPSPDATPWSPPEAAAPPVLEALPMPQLPQPWEMTSFSSLTREKNPHAPVDETPLAATPAPIAPNPFFDAPGGAVVGTAIHDWIEQWDFADLDLDKLRSHLGKYPLPVVVETPPFAERVHGMLEQLRTAVLPGAGQTIATACPLREASEWHFQLPIHDALSPRSLARVFDAHGHEDYAKMLAALPGEDLRGFLQGFLDRLTFHDGVWGVIDWKTNKLDAGYDTPALLDCAMRSHYLLQTHLYLVALRRYLGPDVGIAGAWLVFLRGVRAGSGDGILHIQPSAALMTDLDALFAAPACLT